MKKDTLDAHAFHTLTDYWKYVQYVQHYGT